MRNSRDHSAILFLKLLVFILIAIALSMCKPSRAKDQISNGVLRQNDLIQKLVKSPLLTIDQNNSAFFDSDTLYLLNFGLGKELSLRFKIQIIPEDGSFVNQGIDQNEKDDGSAYLEKLGISRIIKFPIFTNQFNALILDQYYQADGDIQEKGKDTISFQQLMGNGKQECIPETSFNQEALYDRIFQEHLKQGVFARIPSGYFILLIHKTCYIFTNKRTTNAPNLMLHFIRKDKGFDNYSFSLKEPSFEKCLNQTNDLIINRINLRNPFENYIRIRVGEYRSSGNLWAQEYTIERLTENGLLRYEGEFNDLDKTE